MLPAMLLSGAACQSLDASSQLVIALPFSIWMSGLHTALAKQRLLTAALLHMHRHLLLQQQQHVSINQSLPTRTRAMAVLMRPILVKKASRSVLEVAVCTISFIKQPQEHEHLLAKLQHNVRPRGARMSCCLTSTPCQAMPMLAMCCVFLNGQIIGSRHKRQDQDKLQAQKAG